MELPAVFTVTRYVNTPRALSFYSIIISRKKEITIWDLPDLTLPEDQVGLKGSPTIVSDLTPLKGGQVCEILTSTPEEKDDLLISKFFDAGLI